MHKKQNIMGAQNSMAIAICDYVKVLICIYKTVAKIYATITVDLGNEKYVKG